MDGEKVGGLVVLVSEGRGVAQAAETGRFRVNTLEAGLEKRDSLEAEWRREGWQRDGHNPVRFYRGNEWRRAVVVRIVGEEGGG